MSGCISANIERNQIALRPPWQSGSIEDPAREGVTRDLRRLLDNSFTQAMSVRRVSSTFSSVMIRRRISVSLRCGGFSAELLKLK